MRGFKRAKFFKEKGVVIALVLCLVSIAAIAGVYVVEQGRQQEQNLVNLDRAAKNETAKKDTSDSKEAATDRILNEETDKQDTDTKEDQAAVSQKKEEPKQEEKQTVKKVSTPKFKEGDRLSWPVKGNVILDYSMDKTVYFSTLEEYKYNPGMLIAGNVNTKVTAAADGIVKSVKINEETGNTVTMDLGGGFTAVYGQLKEVPVKAGATLKAGQTVGYVSEPTKYYSVEGSNLYFQVLKDGKPVDPMRYLK